MKKAVLMWLMVFLIVNSLFAAAQTDSSGDTSSSDSSSCNWWCKVTSLFGGNVVGK